MILLSCYPGVILRADGNSDAAKFEMSGQTLLATFGPLALGAILVGIGISGTFLKANTKARLEGTFRIVVGLLYVASIVWAIASQRSDIAVAFSVCFMLYCWNSWRGREVRRPKLGRDAPSTP